MRMSGIRVMGFEVIAIAALLLLALSPGAASTTTTAPADHGQPPATIPAKPVPVPGQFVDLLASEQFAAAGKMFDSTMRHAMTDEQLAAFWRDLIATHGAFEQQSTRRTTRIGRFNVAFIVCQFARAEVTLRVVHDDSDHIGGLFIESISPKEDRPAAYVDSAAFDERAVTVGQGKWALPGTLSLPKRGQPCPAVVLVHGSGPQDRDETIGPNKPFRDLAWGLASRGIVVLRYDKRTLAHRMQLLVTDEPLTTRQEVTNDALAAVALLRKTKEIDSDRIFVLGHSLGGTLVPRIAAGDEKIAGFIILAGSTTPMEDAIVEQVEYLVSLQGAPTPEADAQVKAIREQSAQIKALRVDQRYSRTELFAGAPAEYWLDLRDYDPALSAQTIESRMLILQGGRDYQVTTKDFDRWKAKLSGRTDVKFQLYPALNHLFIAGQGRPTPAEYQQPGHVSEEVIRDIVDWIGVR